MQKKLHIIINKYSGTVLRLGEARVEELVRGAFGGSVDSFHMVEAKDMCATIDALGHDPASHDLVIGGGDGSAVCAAEHLAKRNVHFGILPLGTMNLLAQDLGAAPTFEETIERFAAYREDMIDLGIVNDRFFLCSAVIGLVPESAIAREELRDENSSTLDALARFVTTIARGMGGVDKQSLQLQLSQGAPFALETTSLIISNNRFVRNPEVAAARFMRETLKDGKLAVYSAAPEDMIDGLRLLVKMIQGDWQEDQAIFSFETPSLDVTGPQQKILVSLDGEPLEMTSPLKFSIERKSLPVLRMDLKS